MSPRVVVPAAVLGQIGDAVLRALVDRGGDAVATAIVQALSEIWGAAWVRGRVDAWEAARRAADAAADAKFGGADPPTNPGRTPRG